MNSNTIGRMIESISFKNVKPKFIDDAPAGASSMVWNCDVIFNRGCSYLVEAASGRGKSSFCSFLYGLRSDFGGNIIYKHNGCRALQHADCDFQQLRRESISMMFQELRLFSELSPVDNVMLKSNLTGFATETEVRGMLERLGLAGHLDTPCAVLSFGQQQRVAFVRALCQPFDFILLDEPVSHLDNENAAVMSAMLKERQLQNGAGVIVTSIGYRMPYLYDKILNL